MFITKFTNACTQGVNMMPTECFARHFLPCTSRHSSTNGERHRAGSLRTSRNKRSSKMLCSRTTWSSWRCSSTTLALARCDPRESSSSWRYAPFGIANSVSGNGQPRSIPLAYLFRYRAVFYRKGGPNRKSFSGPSRGQEEAAVTNSLHNRLTS